MLQNSQSVLAVVVYTGTDTKLIKNFGNYKFKRPRFEIKMNLIIFIEAILFFIFTSLCTLGNYLWNRANYNDSKYIFEGVGASEITYKVFFSHWLINNSLMPLEAEVVV